MPTCSVIIPTYNRASMIHHAIRSVLQQTFADLELLVIDDGSTDNTREVVAGISDPRIRLLVRKKNEGQNPARNYGIALATGEFIAFLDSDDEWLPTMLEQQISNFRKNPEIDCSYSWLGVERKDGLRQTINRFKLEGDVYPSALTQGYIAPTITLMVRSNCFTEIGMFDPYLTSCEDDDICLRLAKRYRFGLIPQALAVIRYHEDDRITGDKTKKAEGWWRLHNKYRDDTLLLCGSKVLANHFIKCGLLFLVAGDNNSARTSFSEASKFHSSIATSTLQLGCWIPGLYSSSVFIIDQLRRSKHFLFPGHRRNG